MHDGLESLLWIVGTLIAYAFLANRLMVATHPLRERAGKAALELLRDDRLPLRHKRALARACNDLMNEAAAWGFVLRLPYYAIKSIRTPDPVDAIRDTALRNRVRQTLVMSAFCTLTMSPAALLLFVIQCVIGVLLTLPLVKILDVMAERPGWNTAGDTAPGHA